MSHNQGKKIIAVTGATGKQGGGVVKALLKHSEHFAIRAITRDVESEKSKALVAQGVEVVAGDMNDVASLTAAFQGCHGAFFVTDFWTSCKGDPQLEYTHGKNLVDSAKAANVVHVVWSGLEDTRGVVSTPPLIGDMPVPHFDAKMDITRYLEKSGVPATTVLTSIFFENLFGMIAPTPNGLTIANIIGETAIPWIHCDDIGNAVATIFQQGPAEWVGKTIGLATEVISFPQICKTIGDVIGKQINFYNMPDEQYVGMMSQWMPKISAQEFGAMFAYYRDHNAVFSNLRSVELTKKLVGGPVTDTLAFATANKAVLEKIGA